MTDELPLEEYAAAVVSESRLARSQVAAALGQLDSRRARPSSVEEMKSYVLMGEDEVALHMDVPGLDREHLEIELDSDLLRIRGRFECDLRVPKGLEPDSIEASLRDGVLTLRIPTPESLEPHRIEISP